MDAEHGAIILVLPSGTRIVDRHDRIDDLGTADDIAVDEIVEAVRRCGWDVVDVEGDMAFRVAVTKGLRALDPPVHVAGCPLSDYEMAEIDDARAPTRPLSLPASTAPSPAQRAGPGGS